VLQHETKNYIVNKTCALICASHVLNL